MANLRGKKIYGISLIDSVVDNTKRPYLNLGEGRFKQCSWDEFFSSSPSWQAEINENGKTVWANLIQNLSKTTLTFRGSEDLKEMLVLMQNNNFIELKEKVAHFKTGQYLLERKEFVKLSDGSIKYKPIEHYNGYEIKLQKNGDTGFTIFKGDRPMEDRIWSIEGAKQAINDMLGINKTASDEIAKFNAQNATLPSTTKLH